jgi:CheY-like chemotaxis protein
MALCFIVDDHDDTREGFAEYLRDCGFDVRTAQNAGELRTLLRTAKPAAILMDVHMPKVSGWTLTREIKSDSRTRAVRVVVFSAAVSAEDRRMAAEAGADGFLAKPCDPQTIVEELTRLLALDPDEHRVRISTG